MPRGSVSGPLLFLIYINDLPDCVTSSTVRLFADDTVLYHGMLPIPIADTADLQRDLDALQAWECKWLMEFNPSKCQILRVTLKGILHSLTLRNEISSTHRSCYFLQRVKDL